MMFVDDSLVLVREGPLVALLNRPEARQVNGILRDPPKLFVLVRNEEFQTTKLVPVDWAVVSALASPELSARFERAMKNAHGAAQT